MLDSVSEQMKLGEKLARCPEVARYDSAEEPQGFTLAYNLAHLEESFQVFLTKQLPLLVSTAETPDDILGALHDIGEELRHILYHIRDPQFFSHLRGDDD